MATTMQVMGAQQIARLNLDGDVMEETKPIRTHAHLIVVTEF
jgi:hypothetical protein